MTLQTDELLLGKYKVIETIGSGGWGDVYLAEDLQLGRRIAIKHLQPRLTREKIAVERFLREAKIIAGLKHRNIVTIFAFERNRDDHYMIMEYAENGTLEDLMAKEGALALTRVLELVIDICLSLHFVHTKEIIHRDIKPSNILLFEDVGHKIIPKLADFGVARTPLSEQNERLTAANSVLGTVSYMAPEQAIGGIVDARSDIYAIGVLLYEALTGHPPYTGNYLDILVAKTKQDPRPPNEIRQDIPPALNQLIMKALSREPESRFDTAQEMAEALRSIAGETIEVSTLAKLESLYNEGLIYLEKNAWQAAIDKFTQLMSIAPNYRDAQKRLQQAKQGTALEELYQQGMRHRHSREWSEAVDSFGKLLKQCADYKDVKQMWEEVKVQQSLQVASQDIQRCHKLIEKERWSEAEECFRKILNKNIGFVEAQYGFERARRGEEATYYFQLATECLDQGRLDDANKLLTTVIDQMKGYHINTEKAQTLLQKVKLRLELRTKYKELEEAKREKHWSMAVRLLNEIITLDPQDEQAKAQLEVANEEHQLQTLYYQLSEDIARAERGKGVWSVAEYRIRDIERIRSDYDDLTKLKKKVENNKRWAAWYSDLRDDIKRKRWDKAIETCNKIIRDYSKYESGVYKDVYKLLKKAENAKNRTPIFRKLGNLISTINQRRKRSKLHGGLAYLFTLRSRISKRWRISIEVILGMLGLVIAFLSIPGVKDAIFVYPSNINRYEIFVDGRSIKQGSISNESVNVAELLELTGGKLITLKVDVIDTNNIRYSGDSQLKCTWEVAPIDSEEEDIVTESCETLFTPSHLLTRQIVAVSVEAVNQQFNPVPPISMEFDISPE